MAKLYAEITPELQRFIAQQPLFFVASAPLAGAGHVNLSPKGLDCFRVLSPHRVAYMDLVSSGNETSAHLRENGRITLLFCAFAGPPRILRLYGTGAAALPGSAAWAELRPLFPGHPGARQLVVALAVDPDGRHFAPRSKRVRERLHQLRRGDDLSRRDQPDTVREPGAGQIRV